MERSVGGVEIGSIISERYQIEEILGLGASGIVVRAKDLVLNNNSTALKLLPSKNRSDAKAIERFRREVYLMRQLTHPNVVRIFDFGEVDDGPLFLSMEFVSGNTLAERIATEGSEGSSLSFVVNVLYQLCLGMIEAHSKGIIHRDLKPHNLIINDEDVVKIVDFGTARMLNGDKSSSSDGVELGTPFYSSPEQLLEKRADERSDIYSFGIIGFELISGRVPFTGETHYQVTKQHCEMPLPKMEPKSKLRIPYWFSEFILKCTAKDPDDRFQSFLEIRDFLIPYVTNSERLSFRVSVLRPLGAVLRSTARDFRGFVGSNWIKLLGLVAILVAISFLIGARLNEKYNRRLWMRTILVVESHLNLRWSGIRTIMNWDLIEGVRGLEFYTAPATSHDSDLTTVLWSGVDPNSIVSDGRPVIFTAIKNRNIEILQIILDWGADPRIIDPVNGETPLIAAFRDKDSLAEKVLLRENTAIHAANNRDFQGKTIYNALLENTPDDESYSRFNVEILEKLVALGASLDVADVSGNTALLLAARECLLKEFEYLMERSNLTVVNAEGKSVSSFVQSCVQKNVEKGEVEVSSFWGSVQDYIETRTSFSKVP